MVARTNLLDPELKTFGTERQSQYLDAINFHGSLRAAAVALGVHHSSISRSMDSLERSAALRGYSPSHEMVNPVPKTHVAKGVSTLYDGDGKVRAQWVKSTLRDDALEESIKAAAAAFCEEMPRLAPIPMPEMTADQLLNVYTMTDCHVGMLAWGKETGEPWDLEIAERVLSGCFEQMVLASPKATTCYIAQLGDFLHSDGMEAVTPTSKHILDQDGRFAKVVQVAIRVLRRLVDIALFRHQKVYVLLAEGNHDLASSIWLRAMFRALYENEPRVIVIDSEYPYYAHQHGKTMVAFHHGHLKKKEGLPLLFASTFSKLWGDTTKRYCHTGHQHHTDEKEHSGMSVFQHQTLAARDAYAARGGWVAERATDAITYHTEFGEVGRVKVCADMLA